MHVGHKSGVGMPQSISSHAEPYGDKVDSSSQPILDQHTQNELTHLDGQTANILVAFLSRHPQMDLTDKVVVEATCPEAHGGLSDIFIGYYGTEKRKVAVKKLRVSIKTDEGKIQKSLAKELLIWSKLQHPRILAFEGLYIEGGRYAHLVSEWMENGTALTYLSVNPDTDLVELVLGIAEGIEYLHTSNIVHSDIKPENVLISSSGSPLLCDFGASRVLFASNTLGLSGAGLRGTVRYMSRETISAHDNAYSKESDVWSFGMTVLALLTGRHPFSDYPNDLHVALAINNNALPPRPIEFVSWPAAYQELWKMCLSCWHDLPDRSTISSVILKLKELKGNGLCEPSRANSGIPLSKISVSNRATVENPSRNTISLPVVAPNSELSYVTTSQPTSNTDLASALAEEQALGMDSPMKVNGSAGDHASDRERWTFNAFFRGLFRVVLGPFRIYSGEPGREAGK